MGQAKGMTKSEVEKLLIGWISVKSLENHGKGFRIHLSCKMPWKA